MFIEVIEKDIVILGSGLSSLYTALHLDSKFNIGIVTKETLEINNSSLAQGGVAASYHESDHWQAHYKDTLKAGAYHNDHEATEILVKSAKQEIEILLALGVAFDLDEHGKLKSTLEGGHSNRRVLHAGGDATGDVIMSHLIKHIREKAHIALYEHAMAVEIMTSEHGTEGIIAFNDGKLLIIKSTNVIIATGGIGRLFTHTTNRAVATGDGIALASKAKCELKDMSFIQFHPTAFLPHGDERCFLISEAVRGEGGKLRGYHQQAFMKNIDSRGDLAPRDVVARGIFEEMTRHDLDHIWLDITHKDQMYLENRFPTIYNFLKDREIYMEKDLIPVTPVAHYFVGGIKVNVNGETSVSGIYACGEAAATGVHGANRLASNSLLECLVFGRRVAEHINHKPLRLCLKNNMNLIADKYRLHYENSQYNVVNGLEDIKQSINRIMTSSVGIVRNDETLNRALKEVTELECTLSNYISYNRKYYEVKHMVYLSKLIIMDALHKDSIGCHFKSQNSELTLNMITSTLERGIKNI